MSGHDQEFVESVRSHGLTIDEPKNHWRCRWRGCDLPGPNVVERRSLGPNQETGKAGDIECRRCGRRVGPFDSDYPTIRPGGAYSVTR